MDRLPRIASVSLTKVKEFKLRKEFKAVVEANKVDGNRIEDWGLARGGGEWKEKKSRRREKDWGLEALQGHGLVVGDLNVR